MGGRGHLGLHGRWAELLRGAMCKPQLPLTPVLESQQGTLKSPRLPCLPLLDSATLWARFLEPLPYFVQTPKGPCPNVMATAALQPAGPTSLWPPTFTVRPVKACPCCSSIYFLWFPSPFCQGEATGQLYSDIVLKPEVTAPFSEFLRNPALAKTRV